MREIERIIDDLCKKIDPNYNGEIYIRDRNHTLPNNWTRLSKSAIAKAIEQYLLDFDFCNHCVAELKKGLTR